MHELNPRVNCKGVAENAASHAQQLIKNPSELSARAVTLVLADHSVLDEKTLVDLDTGTSRPPPPPSHEFRELKNHNSSPPVHFPISMVGVCDARAGGRHAGFDYDSVPPAGHSAGGGFRGRARGFAAQRVQREVPDGHALQGRSLGPRAPLGATQAFPGTRRVRASVRLLASLPFFFLCVCPSLLCLLALLLTHLFLTLVLSFSGAGMAAAPSLTF